MYTPVVEIPKKEKKLYPERAFSSVDESIERLKKLQSGEIKKAELSEQERSEILSFENKLGIELEEIFGIKVKTAGIYPEYLATNIGKASFRSCMEFDIENEDMDSIEAFVYRARGRISNISGVQLKGLEAKAKKYTEDRIIGDITKTISESGEISIAEVQTHKPINIVLNPEVALEKLQKLREFKRELKNYEAELHSGNKGVDFDVVMRDIVIQYRERVNELITEQFAHVVEMKLLADRIGEENLSTDEIALLAQFSGLERFVSVYARFDKHIFGIDGEADKNGNYKQIGEEMESYANEAEDMYIENERSKKNGAAEIGLSYNKLKKEDISKDVFSHYAEAFLDLYGQKSSQPPEEFDSNRKGPAPDGKWQFVPSFSYSSMDVEFKQHAIKAPAKDRSVASLVSVLLGHEFTHVKQGINQEKIKLRLFNEVCGNRRFVLAEGAAMSVQDEVSKELFGYNELPKPNYIKAMSEKVNGGNYLDCVKAYYDCSLRIYKGTTEKVDQNKLKKEAEKMLGVAIRSCKRLFRAGEQLDAKTRLLAKSKDTVYLEQMLVMRKLKELGLEKFALVRGINLDSLFVLLKDGFISENDIEMPDIDFVRNVWEQLKGDYLLEQKK